MSNKTKILISKNGGNGVNFKFACKKVFRVNTQLNTRHPFKQTIFNNSGATYKTFCATTKDVIISDNAV